MLPWPNKTLCESYHKQDHDIASSIFVQMHWSTWRPRLVSGTKTSTRIPITLAISELISTGTTHNLGYLQQSKGQAQFPRGPHFTLIRRFKIQVWFGSSQSVTVKGIELAFIFERGVSCLYVQDNGIAVIWLVQPYQ